MHDETTQDPGSLRADRVREPALRPALVIVWSRAEPERVGDVMFLPSAGAEPRVVGRGPARADDPHPRGGWLRQRPGVNQPRPPLGSSALSRVQLVIEPHAEGARLRNVGRRALSIDGAPTEDGVLREGSCALLEDELLVYAARRPVAMPALRAWPASIEVEHGRADPFGIVGESAAAWALRDELAFAAGRALHVLVHGPTGTGKELAARAIHGLGGAGRPFVARNAATIPAGIVDAELFGNLKDYPNGGMKERPGLVGAADGGTLFLDEIGELPEELQARLLRVLDRGGEYQRLGEERSRSSSFRLIGATNRPIDRLKHDLLARLMVRIELPSLDERREDLPWLAQSIVLAAAESDPALEAMIVERVEGARFARLAPELIAALMTASLTSGVRELATILWRCIQKSTGRWVALPPEVAAELARDAEPLATPSDLDEDRIRSALDEHDWVVARAYRQLGLKNRHVLVRLMKKLGIERAP